MKKTVYLDTTIPSYLFDERESIRAWVDITRRWWAEERQRFDLWMSEETFSELDTGHYPKKQEVLAFISGVPILSLKPEVLDIAETYRKNYLMPQKLAGDALHLAYASYYNMDFLLTWNCNHLANANKKQHIRIINTRMNLSTPEITTPFQLFTEFET
uniref:Predicted nucleic acid-binding protein, contains PIN domain n=1 Tax=Candidatus Kentrum sp. FM TaxID=2126340 RepID=A0A450TPP8_9GAMM|nr:MAG: Predicted nucleic acid-binding protein, contains PIN domain [Candidatus Kentron sp. FM]VFJ69958.1 MAG: Predicted nucleic acid-binding protein, contains PIN domain [Candidatus Kentron sp. FM]VFK18195.1 MAG: Predicted nucleic acid-binding protein, contains PIN domain [Candidatus Kentron sp. FM]